MATRAFVWQHDATCMRMLAAWIRSSEKKVHHSYEINDLVVLVSLAPLRITRFARSLYAVQLPRAFCRRGDVPNGT